MVTCFAGPTLPRDEHTLVTSFVLHCTVCIVRYCKTVRERGGVCEWCEGGGVCERCEGEECVSGVRGWWSGVCGWCEGEGWSV